MATNMETMISSAVKCTSLLTQYMYKKIAAAQLLDLPYGGVASGRPGLIVL